MKRALLPTLLALASFGARAQCTPNQLYADSVYGVWPDTLENFADGTQGMFYTDTLNLLIPQNAQDIDPGYPAIDIDSVQLVGVSGLPPGLGVICNSQTGGACTYLPTVVGCGLIEGIPTASGSYPLTIDVLVWFTLFGSANSLPNSFSGYEITIAPATGISEANATLLHGARNTPNPFASRTSIDFELAAATPVTIAVYDMVGQELQRIKHDGVPGTNKVVFDGSERNEGVYLYKIEAGGASFTGRMVLHR